MTVQNRQSVPNREYKSRMFVRIFEDKQKLLELVTVQSQAKFHKPDVKCLHF